MAYTSRQAADWRKVNPEYTKEWRKQNPEKVKGYTNRTKQIRQANKKKAVEYLGGSCKHCGLKTDKYSVYDFHHLDPSEKEHGIGKLVASWKKLVIELDKCILLCANCHRIVHHEDKADILEKEVE